MICLTSWTLPIAHGVIVPLNRNESNVFGTDLAEPFSRSNSCSRLEKSHILKIKLVK